MMSASLKERLKKCGRYHAGTPKHQNGISPNLKSMNSSGGSESSEILNPNSSIHDQEESELNSTPKRKSSLQLGDESLETKSGIIKRRKVVPYKKTSDSDLIIQSKTINPNCHYSSHVDNKSKAALTIQKSSEDKCDPETHLSTGTGSVSLAGSVVNHQQSSSTDSSPCVHLVQMKTQLENDLKQKEEKLRKLKMVAMYNEKNNLTELETTISKWREVTQQALQDLLDLHPEPRPSMTELINHLQIDPSMVNYNAEEDEFI